MRANEVVRFRCGDCQIVFDLCVDREGETEVVEGAPVADFGEPVCCPSCGAGELTPAQDRAIRVALDLLHYFAQLPPTDGQWESLPAAVALLVPGALPLARRGTERR